MAEKMKEPLFNAGAEIYDSFTFLRGPAELTVEKAGLSAGQSVLDVACGSGWATIPAARITGPNGHVTGMDIADKLLDIAGQKTAAAGITNIDYVPGDAQDMQFPDSTFDVILCASSLFLFSDKQKALIECYRVLKRGGKMIFSVFGRGIFQPVMKMIDDRLAEFGKTDLPEPVISVTDSPEKCRGIFKNAGFGDMEITQETLKIRYADKEECWSQISHSVIVRPRLNRLEQEEYGKLKSDILTELDEYFRNRDVEVEVPVLFCSVKKF